MYVYIQVTDKIFYIKFYSSLLLVVRTHLIALGCGHYLKRGLGSSHRSAPNIGLVIPLEGEVSLVPSCVVERLTPASLPYFNHHCRLESSCKFNYPPYSPRSICMILVALVSLIMRKADCSEREAFPYVIKTASLVRFNHVQLSPSIFARVHPF